MSKIVVDTTLERTTEFVVEGNGPLLFSTSSTPGIQIDKVWVDGVHITDLPEGLYEQIVDALYSAGYAT